MKTPSLLVAVALAFIGGCRTAAPPPAPAAPPAASASAPAEALPGVPLEGLSPEQQRILAEYASSEFCYCGCPHTISACLRTHRECKHAPRMAQVAARIVAGGGTIANVREWVRRYYASFDHRARLDVKDFGPPLGDPEAPIVLVEYSDFTCPFCQRLRPVLESFVQERAGRVKLFFKPFPIESHPGALETAITAEWARDHGLFWPMHDALFSNPEGHDTEDLVSQAEALGGDGSDLRDALLTRRNEHRIRAAQAEARAAGMVGTPTLYLDGRMVEVPGPVTEEWLEFTLQDEEEWKKHGGWERD
jgi:protein-disulfide isomerase